MLFIVMALGAVGFAVVHLGHKGELGSVEVAGSELSSPIESKRDQSGRESPEVSGSEAHEGGWSPMGDEATRAKIIEWFESHGVYGFRGPDEQSDYQNYDLETLKKLGDSGDIRALHMLAGKAESIGESNAILFSAAIHGSTGALSQIALSLETEFDIRNKSVEERKPYIMESLAYYDAAQLRGDWWGNIQGKDSLLKRYPTEFLDVEKAYIQNRAQEIYDDLQQKRTQMGLGDFDNSVPDEVIKFYEEMLRPL